MVNTIKNEALAEGGIVRMGVNLALIAGVTYVAFSMLFPADPLIDVTTPND